MHITTISIDLGASFTKVGFRLGCAPTAGQPFEFEARVLTISGDALIPSLAVKTNQDRLPWLFGQDAADSRRGPGLEFCTNWKKGLYRPDNDAEAVKSAIIAHRFFEWLRINLTPVTDEWSTVRVRVTLPAFGYAAKLEGVVRRCMNLAGWEPYELTFSTEPHANAIGLLTLGRNVVNRGRMSRTVDLGRMLGYGNPYLEQARAVVLRDSHKRILRLAIIDIGAFTTDVARLDFDVAAPEANSDGLTHIQPDSFPVGIHEDLDMAFWNGLAERYGPVNEQLTFREQESLKHALFARRTYGLIVKSHSWIIGGADDQSVVEEVSQQFAEEIWRNIGSLFGSNTADVVFLTGGGSQIAPLVQALQERLPSIKSDRLAVAAPTTSGGIEWKPWRNSDQPIERVATAIGAVSVLPPTELIQTVGMMGDLGERSDVDNSAERINPRGERIRTCTCQGNPDCPRCGGTGYLPY